MIHYKIITIFLATFLFVILEGCGVSGGSGDKGTNGGTTNPGGGTPAAGMLLWDQPTSNTDGSPITDLTAYRVYYGTTPGSYIASINVGNVTSVSLSVLSSTVPAPGIYYIAVTALDVTGNESAYSNEIQKKL